MVRSRLDYGECDTIVGTGEGPRIGIRRILVVRGADCVGVLAGRCSVNGLSLATNVGVSLIVKTTSEVAPTERPNGQLLAR